MEKIGLFASFYNAPIEYYALLIKYKNVRIEVYENFIKQSHRNRCYIMSPNGIQALTIPIVKARRKKIMKDVQIFNTDNWKKNHWKSLESAYRSSPYFEYYEDEFFPFYNEKEHTFLLDFNTELTTKVSELIGIKSELSNTTKYETTPENITNYRSSLSTRKENEKLPRYMQVFEDRNEFIPNLSVLDLLFNEGPNSINYLNKIANNV